MKDIIITVISVILLVVIVFAFVNESSRGQDLQQINSYLEVKTSAYRQEKLALQEELKDLQSKRQEKEKGVGSLMFVFSEINNDFTEEIVPMLDAANCVATLCLGDAVFDLISPDYISGLVAKGWETALYWNGNEDFDIWYANALKKIEAEAVKVPDVICLNVADYDDSIDDALYSCGFNTVIINVGTSNSYIEDDDNRLNKINAHPWYTTVAATCLSSGDIYNSQLVFFVGASGTELAYDRQQFTLMLNSATAKTSDGKMTITTPKRSLEQVAKNDEEFLKSLAEYEARVKELENAISDLDEKIDDVYRRNN